MEEVREGKKMSLSMFKERQSSRGIETGLNEKRAALSNHVPEEPPSSRVLWSSPNLPPSIMEISFLIRQVRRWVTNRRVALQEPNGGSLSHGSVRSPHPRDERVADEHPEDVGEGDGLAGGLLGPQSLDVGGDVLGHEQTQRVAAHALHQFLVDLLRAFGGEVWVGVQSGHVPAGGREGGEHDHLSDRKSVV